MAVIGERGIVMFEQAMRARNAHPGELSEYDDTYLWENAKPIYWQKGRSALFAMVVEWKREDLMR
jgi:hypothetical protein